MGQHTTEFAGRLRAKLGYRRFLRGTPTGMAGQDVEEGDDEGTWRIARGTTPDRVVSTVDPDSRHVRKSRSSYRDGFKAHVSVEPATGLIVASRLTPGNTPDGDVAIDLLEGEHQPAEVLAESAYGSGATRQDLDDADHTQADTARKYGVDVSTVIKLRRDAKDAALAVFAATKPGRSRDPRDVRIDQLTDEIARLTEAIKEQAIELALLRGKSRWG